jgi:hypothetical protein
LSKLAAFRALSGDDRWLLLEACVASVQARLALYFVSVKRLRGWAVRPGRGSRPVERIVWAVGAAARRTPAATCLSSALALQRVLCAHGHHSELHIGVSRAGGVFAAHAWVEREGRVLVGDSELDTYVRLMSWPAGESPAGAIESGNRQS